MDATENPYRGINAHLNSRLQATGGWPDFHTNHISDLLRALKAQVTPLGYTAALEDGLQIRRIGEPPRFPRADVTVYDPDPIRATTPLTLSGATSADTVLPLVDLLEDEAIDAFKAIAIYTLTPAQAARGEPVAWIELLSPSNKPPARDFQQYALKRRDVLGSGIVFVEIDYLHRSPPTLRNLPDYSAGDEGAHPVRVTVIDPRPDVASGEGRSWHVDIDAPLPSVQIPLNAADRLIFDLDAPYQKTFAEALYGPEIDYSLPPEDFTGYAPADRARILKVMARRTGA